MSRLLSCVLLGAAIYYASGSYWWALVGFMAASIYIRGTFDD